MQTSPCHNPVAGHQIATNFCTCQDSTAVVPCTKFCGDHCIRSEVRVKRNFHRIWITMEKPLVKRAPGLRPGVPYLLLTDNLYHGSTPWLGFVHSHHCCEMVSHICWCKVDQLSSGPAKYLSVANELNVDFAKFCMELNFEYLVFCDWN